MTVGAIEELEFMDLEICNTSTLREMRKVLAIFLSDLQDDVCDDSYGRRGSRCKIFVHGGCDDDG